MPSRPRLLQPGAPGAYDSGGAYVGLAEPIPVGDEYRYYYYASADRHDAADVGGNPAQRPSLAFATFPRNRLVGQQTEHDGSFATLPIMCPGGRLHLNFVARGEVRVAIKRPGYGSDYEGFRTEDCFPVWPGPSNPPTPSLPAWKRLPPPCLKPSRMSATTEAGVTDTVVAQLAGSIRTLRAGARSKPTR